MNTFNTCRRQFITKSDKAVRFKRTNRLAVHFNFILSTSPPCCAQNLSTHKIKSRLHLLKCEAFFVLLCRQESAIQRVRRKILRTTVIRFKRRVCRKILRTTSFIMQIGICNLESAQKDSTHNKKTTNNRECVERFYAQQKTTHNGILSALTNNS